MPRKHNTAGRRSKATTRIIRFEDGRPVIACARAGDIQVKFYCSHCGTYHHHGRGGTPDDIGLRAAHCVELQSPFARTGYYLELCSGTLK